MKTIIEDSEIEQVVSFLEAQTEIFEVWSPTNAPIVIDINEEDKIA